MFSVHQNNHDLVYERAPARWFEGVPLGNGYLGAMLWGDGRPLRLTLDNPNIWEMRETLKDPEHYNYNHIRQLVEQKKWGELNHACSALPVGCKRSDRPYPTRIPLPRMEITAMPFASGRLRLADATWQAASPPAVKSPADAGWQAFAHATRKLFIMKGLPLEAMLSVNYVPKTDPSIGPDSKFMGAAWGWPEDILFSPAWGYPPLERGQAHGVDWVRQVMPGSGEYVIAWRRRGDELLLTILSRHAAAAPLDAAQHLLHHAPAYDTLRQEHCAWWRDYWKKSSITLPDKKLENLYYAELYKLGSSSRPDGAAMPLCGVWPHDQVMPYCWNDYHLDWNVQAAYWLVLTSNHLDMGISLYETFWKMVPRFRENCKKYFGIDGLWTSSSLGLTGMAMCGAKADLIRKPEPHGWGPLSVFGAMLPWLTHNYWLHYRYSRDLGFLRERVVPLLKGCWRVYNHILEQGSDGKLHLPISHSPEYMECTPEVWQKDTAFEAALIRFVCRALLESEQVLDRPDPDSAGYRKVLNELYDYPGEKEIFIAADMPLKKSHRHHCHLLGVYPLEELTVEGPERDRARIDRSMMRIQELGTGEWCGHGFTAYALVAARAGYPHMAWKWLQDYFYLIAPNSLVRHGDPRRFGASRFTFEITAVDGGFSAAAAILEMLLQSWGGVIRVFPAVPEFWADVSFNHLLAEGNVLVSAERRAGRTVWIELQSNPGGRMKVKNVFGGAVRAGNMVLDGELLELKLQAGENIRLEPILPVAGSTGAGARVEGDNWFGLKHVPVF